MGARIAPHVADTVTARCTALPTQAEPPDCTITYALDVRIHATIDGGKSKWGVRVDTPV